MSRYRSSPAEDESERELQVQSEPFQAAKWFSGLFRVRAHRSRQMGIMY